VIRFKRGGGKMAKVSKRWKGRKIEEVKEIKYLGYAAKKWGTRGTDKGQNGKGSSDIGTGVGNREKEIWEGLEEKDMVIRQVGLDSDELRSGDMGMKGKGKDGKVAREVFEMGFGGGKENAEVLDKRGSAEREVKGQGRKKSGNLRKGYWGRGVSWQECVSRK